MRYPDRSRMLWADAICINQFDVAEKAIQVQLMREIFAYAQRTLIYLGDIDEKDRHKMSQFALLTLKLGLYILARRVEMQDCPQIAVWNSNESRSRRVAPFSFEFYIELIGMLRMPWFQRAWVVQEVAVSSRATIFWGSSQYEWDDVIRALEFMSRVEFPLAHIVTLESISAIEEERNFYKHRSSKLWSVLLRHQRCLATDPRDKVYAFSGLLNTSPKRQIPVGVNYENDVATVYKEIAAKILVEDQSLDLLSQPPTMAISEMKSLPSWVPDWSISSLSTLTNAWGHGPLSLAGSETRFPGWNHRFSSTSGSVYRPDASNSDNILKIEGYEFDRVSEVGPVFQGVQLPRAVNSLPDILSEWFHCMFTLLHARRVFILWQKIANVRSKIPYLTGETVREALWQTVSTGEFYDPPRVNMELKMWEEVARAQFGLLLGAFYFVWNFLSKRPFMVFEVQNRCTLHRRLIRTQRGYLGLTSHLIEVGNSVMLCKGSSVPLVFRKCAKAESYQLVGDAYIHGIMHGEGFQARKCVELLVE